MSERREPLGRVTIAPQVLTTIVRQTALSADGVKGLSARIPRRSKHKGRRAVAPGVEAVLAEGKVFATVHINADPTANMFELAQTLQTEIARAIEHIIGLEVAGVDVYVDNVSFPASESD
ncbi:MAG: Asp23/Gls24 family envelope stress response protein [Caldilineae bacterium]|nr:MAG: Asp23/Gls24 family envelope stress response protein [Caldilineae bacterium]